MAAGRARAAAEVMAAFIQQVEAFTQSGRLAPSTAALLQDIAQWLIEILE